ncbi:Dyp-type peroxidase [Kitasatospora sp. NPDC002040]|uniref:Dyp-type peroxidase n=1 Tax=Kitasatospora sp. NPDC002040 TaxID=3154661 RepID=UPI0033252835
MPDRSDAPLDSRVPFRGARPSAGGEAQATGGRWLGIDSEQPGRTLVVQADLTADRVEDCLRTLTALTRALGAAGARPGFARVAAGAPVVAPTVLVGFSARLFGGPWTVLRDDEEHSARWGHRVRRPSSLRMMDAKRDDEYPAFRTESQYIAHETDLVLVAEADRQDQLDTVQEVLREVEAAGGLAVRAVHRGGLLAGGRDPFGFEDGTSNLQYLREHDPERYADLVLDRDLYGGGGGDSAGSYLVFRRYRTFPERLTAAEPLELPASRGVPARSLTPVEVVGRCPASGLVVDALTRRPLPAEPDERQGARAIPQSHVRQANPRGQGTTNFGHAVRVPDARILRRSYPYVGEGPDGTECGLLFMAYQAEIQHSGFEFIHNEWLMSQFNGAPDPLLAPESGLVEPLTGCYYYVPRDQPQLDEVLGELLAQEET